MKKTFTIVILLCLTSHVCFAQDIAIIDNTRSKSINKVKVIVIESGIPDEAKLKQYIVSIMTSLIEKANITVFEQPESSADAILKVEIEGKAISANYVTVGRQYCGAENHGRILFQYTNNTIYDSSFSYKMVPEPFFNSEQRRFPTPDTAPFTSALMNAGFISQIVQMMSSVWGLDSVLVPLASYINGAEWSPYAEEELIKIGKPAESVVINLLHDSNEFRRRKAIRILSQIGGPQSIPSLNNIAKKDKSAKIRAAARDSIKSIEKSNP